MKHPNVVSLREAFTTKAFNDNCASSSLSSNFTSALSAFPLPPPRPSNHSSLASFARDIALAQRTSLITALMMVYDFHPNSATLEEEHLNPEMMAMTPRRKSPPPIPERLLWSYITQIANAIKAVHSSGMALRGLDPSRIILTGKNRYVPS
jgi:serine/threonine protein kinase